MVNNNAKRVIMVNDSRLLFGMLKQVIEKARQLEVGGEIVDLRDLSEKITETNADWVIVNGERNLKNLMTINKLMNAHPSVRFLTITADGSQVSLVSLGYRKENLSGLSLAEILQVLAHQR